jgi:nicotinate-nucleotide adenylyltransferase
MRLGLFGGSFDPIHNGHIRPVREARALLGLDRVICLPTARPPHKSGDDLAPALARYVMTELALLGEEGLEVSAYELTPRRAAYTIDTLEHFRRVHPEADLVLLIGSDSLARLETWHRWREIVAGYAIGVLTRPGSDRSAICNGLPAELVEAEAQGRLQWAEHSPTDISATELRERFAAGEEPPEGAMPELVVEYIRKYPNLYA